LCYNEKIKKIILIALIFSSLSVSACDLCGCSNGSSFVGLLPRSGSKFVGLRYRLRSFDSHLNSQMLKTKEDYQTLEVWGRFYPIKNLQVLAFLPYNNNQQTLLYSSTKERNNGLGDATILAHYNVLNTFLDSTNASGIYHHLMIGGGVKLPIGKFEYGYGGEAVNPNFQLGTGSTDFLLSAIHTVRYKKLGLNTEVGGRISTKSNELYKFGNRLSASLITFYTKNFGHLSIMPNIGSTIDYGFKDHKEGVLNSQTGGYTLLGSLGIQAYYKAFTAGFTFQEPLAQNLGGGELKTRPQSAIFLTIGF
jgi:hypothetical protein